MVRGVAFPDAPRSGYAVVVDLLVNDAIRQQLRKETGVELKSVTRGAGEKGRRRAADQRTDRRRRGPRRAAGDTRPAQQPHQLHRLPRLGHRRVGPDDRDQRAQRAGALRPDLGGGGQRRPDARPGAADRAVRDRRAVPDHRGDGADRRLRAGEVADRIGARAVCRHRARPAGRLHPQDRGAQRGSARRAGAVVQLDDRQHRGSAAAGGREEAARGGAAHRARDPDVAAAAGPAGDGRACR